MSSTAHRLAPVVALLAIVPGALFALDRSEPAIALSTVSVLLIAGSVHWMLSREDRAGGVAE
ncbi:MAG: hypothetical protein ABEH66_04470 [Halobacteriales archaeon]